MSDAKQVGMSPTDVISSLLHSPRRFSKTLGLQSSLDTCKVKPQELGIRSSGWQPSLVKQHTAEKASKIQALKAVSTFQCLLLSEDHAISC